MHTAHFTKYLSQPKMVQTNRKKTAQTFYAQHIFLKILWFSRKLNKTYRMHQKCNPMHMFPNFFNVCYIVSSVQQKSSGLKFSKSRTGSHVTYSYHHNSSRFYLPHICEFVVFLCLPFIKINHATYILTKDTNKFA
jgi:hypothetical protein